MIVALQILDFTTAHIEQAVQIALQNYEEERGFVPALPLIDKWPDLNRFAENNLGVAAFDGGELIGFLCGHGVWENAWGIQGLRNVFSPMHANGAIPENRAKIYARMYQAAGEKWVRAGAVSHAVCLYAHDKEAQEQFFRYGFGLRCVDAIRGMDEINLPSCDGYSFNELMPDNFLEVLPLEKMLCRHMLNSPTFMVKSPMDINEFFTEERFLKNIAGARYFVARKGDAVVAFLCAEVTGETFICDLPGYIHLNGAFCLPEYRGKGVLQGLLSYTAETLKNDGFTKLGTDFESINPAAYGFWLKYFTAYSHGLVRRIDESIMGVSK